MILQVEGSSVVLVTAKKHSKKKLWGLGTSFFPGCPTDIEKEPRKMTTATPPPSNIQEKSTIVNCRKYDWI